MTFQTFFRLAGLRRLLAVLAVLLPGLAAGTPGYTLAPTPDWVQARPLPSLPRGETGGNPMQALLLQREIRLGDDPVLYVRNIRRALTAAGIAQVSELSIDFNPAYQALRLHRVAVVRDGVVRDLTPTLAVRLVQREQELEQGIQDGLVTALLSPEDVQIGDLVDVSYSIAGRNPIFAGRHFGFLALDATYPVAELDLRLLSAPGRPLQVRAHAAPVPVVQRRAGERTEYRVQLRNLKAIQPESEAPAWQNGVNWLEYSEYDNWREVVDWGLGLYAVPEASGPAFESVYAGLAAAARDKADFVARALRFTQEKIRYLGLEFGEGSHRPNAPELVLNRKFGDCKDKSLLLVSLLRRHGIDAVPALVSTSFGEGVAAALPGPGLFDHVITRVELDGQRYWLDGTRLYQGSRLDRIGRVDYGYALVLAPGRAVPEQLYPEFPVEQSSSVEEHYYATDFSGPVRFEVTSRYLGAAAEWQRYQLQATSSEVLRGKLLDYYSHFHEGITSDGPVEVSDDVDGNVVTVVERYRIPAFWTGKPGTLSHSVMLLAFQGVLDKPREVNRRSPFLLSPPRYLSARTYVHYPTDVQLRLDQAPRVIDTPGFRYVSQDRYADRTYYHQAELSILRPWIAAEEVPRMMSAVRKAHAEMDFSLTFRDPAVAGFPEIGRLRLAYPAQGGAR